MKNIESSDLPSRHDVLEERFGRRVAACLNESAEQLSPEINERLRFARSLALEQARTVAVQSATVAVRSGSAQSALIFGNRGPAKGSWWLTLGSVLPLVALVAGLLLIQASNDDAEIAATSEIDAALLADDLPPGAYADAGFAEFLKAPGRD